MRQHRLKILILVLLVIAGWLLHRWGVTTYLIGMRVSLGQDSPNEKRSENIVLPAQGARRGYALVLHGLNFDAEGMKELGQVFANLGYDSLIPRLAGHRGNPDETAEMQDGNWKTQISQWKQDLGEPLICVGYSMGALLLMESHLTGRIRCSAMVLFSPGIAVHVPDWVIRSAQAVWPLELRVPSAIPKDYRHFAYTGLSTTFSFYNFLQSFRHKLENPVQELPKGLVIIDPADQVVDAPAIEALIHSRMPTWKIMKVQAEPLPERHAHHLLVDRKHVGDKQWQDILANIRALTN